MKSINYMLHPLFQFNVNEPWPVVATYPAIPWFSGILISVWICWNGKKTSRKIHNLVIFYVVFNHAQFSIWDYTSKEKID